MPRSTIAGLTLTCLFAAACADQPQPTEQLRAVSGAGPMAAKPAASPKSANISLIVSIDNAAAGLNNDGGGDYIDGVDNVSAYLSPYGFLQFNTDPAKTGAAKRWAKWNVSDPLPGYDAQYPTWSTSYGNNIVSGISAYGPTPYVNIQDLAPGASECVTLGAGFWNVVTTNRKKTTTTWNVSFAYGQEQVSGSPTASALVTANADGSWTMVPSSCGSQYSLGEDVASLRKDAAAAAIGYYHVPFRVTLKRK